jgi:hypothetical protein
MIVALLTHAYKSGGWTIERVVLRIPQCELRSRW